jgi:hypothetical protein
MVAQEIRRRQELYSEFLETAVSGYGEALLRQQPDVACWPSSMASSANAPHSSPEVIEEDW